MSKERVKKPVSCTYEQLSALGPQPLKIGDTVIGQIIPRKFATGSYGLGFTGKFPLQLPDGALANLQCSVNLTVIGSKEAAAAGGAESNGEAGAA